MRSSLVINFCTYCSNACILNSPSCLLLPKSNASAGTTSDAHTLFTKFNVDALFVVDMKQISKAGLVAKVGYTRFAARRLNFYEAEKLCKLLNATIASYDQLYAAWEAGAEHCA